MGSALVVILYSVAHGGLIAGNSGAGELSPYGVTALAAVGAVNAVEVRSKTAGGVAATRGGSRVGEENHLQQPRAVAAQPRPFDLPSPAQGLL